MNSRRLSISALLLSLGLSTMSAQTLSVKVSDDESIKITPTGRFYYDGAVFMEDETDFGNGTSLTDLRLGLKGAYKQWDAKIDIGFANSTVSAKDVFLQYNFKKTSYLRGGHFAEPFGIDHMESSGNIKFMTANATSLAFSPGRKVGIEYVGWTKNMWVGAGVFGDGDDINNKIDGDDGYSVTGRFVFNPIQSPGRIFHVGLAGSYRKADAAGYDVDNNPNPKAISYGSSLLTNVEKRKVLNAKVSDAKYQAKYAAELIAAYGPLYFQGEYFNTLVERKHDLATYKASGAYGQIGFLAIGGNYTYSSSWARMGTPKPKSLEFALRYNYTNLDHKGSGIQGGTMSDWSFATNYYLNKYVTFKLNYNNVDLGKHAVLAPGEDINTIQARVQVIF